jgi:hypothetical protein
MLATKQRFPMCIASVVTPRSPIEHRDIVINAVANPPIGRALFLQSAIGSHQVGSDVVSGPYRISDLRWISASSFAHEFCSDVSFCMIASDHRLFKSSVPHLC